MDIRKLGIIEISELIKKKEVSSPEITKVYLDAIEEEDEKYNAFINVFKDEALKNAEEVQKKINGGELKSPLAGIPVAIKDNLCLENKLTTAGSKMLSNFKPPYTATALKGLMDAGAVILGKTNLDEFAMGGSTETSYYGVSKNPWDLTRVAGGSSGGSASAIASGLAPYSLGSDTGGSIRQPSAFCNLTGIKPSYGSVPRFGLMSYASSLDQIGPMAKSAKECAIILEAISGPDKMDTTSFIDDNFKFESLITGRDIKGLKIGLPRNFFSEGLDREIKENILKASKKFEELGARVEEFDLSYMEYAVPAYYIIACAEASSNLARYDGVKFGYRSPNAENMMEIYYKSRSESFGPEVKRRIMLGSFVLSAGYIDAYYKKALKVRRLIKNAYEEAFKSYDILLIPTTPTPAYTIGEHKDDPLAMYLADMYTITANLTGMSALALPCGFTEEGLPTGMQLLASAFEEEKLLRAAIKYQEETDFHKSDAKGGVK